MNTLGLSTKRVVFIVIAVIKVLLIVTLGPVWFPDSSGYLTYADTMLTSTQWLHTIDLRESMVNNAIFRMVGYPALVAMAKVVSKPHFAIIVVIVQSALSVMAAYAIWNLFAALTRSQFGPIIALIIYISSSSLYDLSILSDSIYNSLYTILFCFIVTNAIQKKAVPNFHLLTVGVIGVLTFLIRESGLYFFCLLLPLLAVHLIKVESSKRRIAQSLALALLPMVMGVSLYQSWNYYRTGDVFITTGGQSAYLTPVVRIGKFGATVFEGQTPLDIVGKRIVKAYSYDPEVWQINSALYKEYGYTAVDIAKAAKQKFYQCLVQYPQAYFSYFVRLMAKAALGGLNFFRDYIHLADIARGEPFSTVPKAKSAVVLALEKSAQGEFMAALTELMERKGYLFTLLLLPFLAIGSLISIVLMLAGLLGAPLMAAGAILTRKRPGYDTQIVIGIWIAAFGMLGIYGLINWEHRYTVGIIPAILAITLPMFQSWFTGCSAILKRGNQTGQSAPIPDSDM